MAYNGYLIKIGNYTVPMSAMIAQTYKVTYAVLDLDSYRDANGILHRNALRKVPTVSVTLNPMNSSQIQTIFTAIRSRYTNATERKVSASVYIPETDSYYDGNFYIPDTEFTIDKIIGGTVFYDPVTLQLIGY